MGKIKMKNSSSHLSEILMNGPEQPWSSGDSLWGMHGLQATRMKYSMAMEMISKGTVKQGLELLTEVSTPPADANGEAAHFADAAFIQLVLIHEIRLKMSESLGQATLARVERVKKSSQKNGDKHTATQADDLLKRWVHDSGKGSPVIALHPDSPLILQLEPTNHCNLRCSMCPRTHMTRPRGYMEPVVFQQALEQWDNRLRTLVLPHLTGSGQTVLKRGGALRLFFMGEPLLHPQIHEYILAGRLMGCTVGFQTNGQALKTPELVDRILEAGPTGIGISLDGITPTTYEAVRQGARWEAMQQNLRLLWERRKYLGMEKAVAINVCSILPKLDPKQADAARAFLKPIEQYVDSISFVPLSREWDPIFYDAAGQQVTYERKKPEKPAKGKPACLEALTKLNVLWNGVITPCCFDIDGEAALGTVDQGIDNVWQSKRAKNLRCGLLRNRIEETLCNRCLRRK